MGKIWDRVEGDDPSAENDAADAVRRAAENAAAVEAEAEHQEAVDDTHHRAREEMERIRIDSNANRGVEDEDLQRNTGRIQVNTGQSIQSRDQKRNKRKLDAAQQLLLLQLQEMNSQIAWYDAEIERLTAENEQLATEINQIEDDLEELENLEPDDPRARAVLDRHGVSSKEELEALNRDKQGRYDRNKSKIEEYERAKGDMERERDQFIADHPDIAAYEAEIRAEVIEENPELLRELSKGADSDIVTEEHREIAHTANTDRYSEFMQNATESNGFGNFGSFAATLDEGESPISYKDDFNIAAIGDDARETIDYSTDPIWITSPEAKV